MSLSTNDITRIVRASREVLGLDQFGTKKADDDFVVNERCVFDMNNLSLLEDISTENLISRGGTLWLSFYDMLKTLHKHSIVPRILVLRNGNGNDGVIGYCMFYMHDENIHISHICLKRKYQGQKLGQKFIFALRCIKSKTITADVSYDNHKSKAFFEHMGFDFIGDDHKHRWKATLYAKE